MTNEEFKALKAGDIIYTRAWHRMWKKIKVTKAFSDSKRVVIDLIEADKENALITNHNITNRRLEINTLPDGYNGMIAYYIVPKKASITIDQYPSKKTKVYIFDVTLENDRKFQMKMPNAQKPEDVIEIFEDENWIKISNLDDIISSIKAYKKKFHEEFSSKIYK